ncbi:MAG: tRNA uridine-5-carboxymethylaminomethyl(34) synthesis GTPase MnmE [Betaproteobacteria bacterium]
MALADSIAAIATPPGVGAIGVVRVSGPTIGALMVALIGREIPPRTAILCDFLNAESGCIDSGLALYFPAPHSYTGEDVLELQGHGGIAVVRLVLRRCVELGARLAEPGEFTRRAFCNGKLDLAQAESIADLIQAESEAAVAAALRSLKGEFSIRVSGLSNAITSVRATIEALIDFPEEELSLPQHQALLETVKNIYHDWETTFLRAMEGARVLKGGRVVLMGAPNVGKSTLLNKLADADLAIVSDVPGTTRDTIDADVEFKGLHLHITDTAGFRNTSDKVEQLGIERALRAASDADLIVLVEDSTTLGADSTAMRQALPNGAKYLRVRNKIDVEGLAPIREFGSGETVISLSARSGAGVELLRSAIEEHFAGTTKYGDAFSVRERHLSALNSAGRHLDQARRSEAVELMAEDLRAAQQALGSITGQVVADDVLGEIFNRFCIGK